MAGTDFATKIRVLAQRIKVSQDDLAPILGISQSRVSQLLRAREIKLSQAFALAKLFDVSLDYLADSSLPIRSEKEIDLDRRIHDVITRLGLERAYNRLILAERTEAIPPSRPQDLPADGVHGPAKMTSDPTHAGHKSRQKSNQ